MLHANFKVVASSVLGTDGDITCRWLRLTGEGGEVAQFQERVGGAEDRGWWIRIRVAGGIKDDKPPDFALL